MIIIVKIVEASMFALFSFLRSEDEVLRVLSKQNLNIKWNKK